MWNCFVSANRKYYIIKILPPSPFTMPTLPARLPTTFTTFFKIGNPFFTPHLDELCNPWKNAECQMNHWVCTAGTYISTSILKRVHKAFFNYYQFHAIANMPDEIFLARMMTTMNLEFERALHYHDGGYESDNNYGLPPCITRPVHIYSMFSVEPSFN